MSDIVENLRELYEFAAKQKDRDWDELDEIRHLFKLTFITAYDAADEIERLREALRTIADGDTPREHAIVYRSDGVYSKHDKCKHGAWMYDGCEDCVTEYARAALGEGK